MSHPSSNDPDAKGPSRGTNESPQKSQHWGRIPIGDLAMLASKHKGTHAILLLYQPGDISHVVTWGKTTEQCAQAAEFGNKLKEALGWPEGLRAQPKRLKMLEEKAARVDEVEAKYDRLKRKVMAQIEGAMGVTAANCTSEQAAKVREVYRKWELID